MYLLLELEISQNKCSVFPVLASWLKLVRACLCDASAEVLITDQCAKNKMFSNCINCIVVLAQHNFLRKKAMRTIHLHYRIIRFQETKAINDLMTIWMC